MKTKCYSIRLKSLVSISDRAFRATAFDGSSAIIPKSQVFEQDFDVEKCDAWWISAFVLEDPERNLQYSDKKQALFNSENGKMIPVFHIEKHKPQRIKATYSEPLKELMR